MTVRYPFVVAVLLTPSMVAVAAEPAADTCEQLRAQIGVLPPGDADLLRRLAARNNECRFSSADFYKAAYGDRPPARDTHRSHHRHHEDDDD